jgi:hypothetical protein
MLSASGSRFPSAFDVTRGIPLRSYVPFPAEIRGTGMPRRL